MLVLSRKVGEKIIIGGNIELTVLDVKGDTIRLGLKAPREVEIHRGEVVEEVSRHNQAAAAVSQDAMLAALGLAPALGSPGDTAGLPGSSG